MSELSKQKNIIPIFKPFLSFDHFSPSSQNIVKEYICNICKGVLNFPVLDNCNEYPETFCKECIEKYVNYYHKCPVKQTHINRLTTIPLKKTEEIINKQEISCINKSLGCSFKGNVLSFRTHIINECQKEKIKCPRNCNNMIFRESLKEHLISCDNRPSKCPYCLEEMSFFQISEHRKNCPKNLVNCIQCGLLIKKEKIPEHLIEKCEEIEVSCYFLKFGCTNNNIKRKELQKHYTDQIQLHNNLMINYIGKIEEKNRKILEQMEERLSYLEVSFKMESYKNQIFIGKKRQKEQFIQNEDEYDAIINNNNNININKNIFDMSSVPVKFFSVQKNKITYISNILEHRFAFLNFTMNKNLNISWTIKINNKEKWFSCGLCDRNKIIENEMKFKVNNVKISHGAFVICSNGCRWNCRKKSEEMIHPNSYYEYENGTIINFTYYPLNKVLEYNYKGVTGKLTEVFPENQEFSGLIPCLIFLYKDTEVEVYM